MTEPEFLEILASDRLNGLSNEILQALKKYAKETYKGDGNVRQIYKVLD